MGVKLIIVMEADFEALYEFRSKAESDAFESGFGMASGLLGSPSWFMCSKDGDGPWKIEDQEEPSQQKRLAYALEQARKHGNEV